MNTITLKDNSTIQFEEFPIKDENMRKISTSINGACPEGIWACFSDEGAKIYDSKDCPVSDKYNMVVILANDAIALYPNPSYGLYIPIKTKGAGRGECNFADQTGTMFWCTEIREAVAKEQAAKVATEVKVEAPKIKASKATKAKKVVKAKKAATKARKAKKVSKKSK